MARMNNKNAKKEIKKVESSEEESQTESSAMEYSGDQIAMAENELQEVEISCDSENSTGTEEVVESEEEASASGEESSTGSGSASEEAEDDETLRTIFIKDIDYDLREDDIKNQMIRWVML